MKSPIGLPNTKLCMWLFLVSEVMFFAGLIGSYIVLRFGTYGWPNPLDILAVRVTAFNTFLLICSSVTMVKAFQWSDSGDRSRAKKYLFATIIGGAGFVAIQGYEYHHLWEEPSTALLEHVEDLMAQRGLSPEAGAAGHEKSAMFITAPATGSVAAIHSNGNAEMAATATGASHITLAAYSPLGMSQSQPGEKQSTPSKQQETAASPAAAPSTEAQNAELIKIAGMLAQGRPVVRHDAPPSEIKPVNDWDKQMLTEAVTLSSLFPNDSKIRELGRHMWLYPEGFRPGDDVFTSTFYTMTGFHGAHVAGGVIALISIFCLYCLGKAGTLAIEVVGLYWHFVDLVWIILFTIVYLM